MASIADPVVNLIGALHLVHRLVTSSVCESVFRELRTVERARKWTLEAMFKLWVGVVSRSPPSLRVALDECFGAGAATAFEFESAPSSFFERAQNLRWEFFQEIFNRFIAALVRERAQDYEADLRAELLSFAEVWIVDGSGMDRVAKRLKVLRDVARVVIPGSVLACYDLFRGIPRVLQFHEKLLGGEAGRLRGLLDLVPVGTLLVADRGYSSVQLLHAMVERGVHGLVRLKRNLVESAVEELSRVVDDGSEVIDRIVTLGTRQKKVRPIRVRVIEKRLASGEVLRLVTTVLDPKRLPALVALRLYRRRWSVERMFFDLKEVLNLHRFYAANTNAVAMQVFVSAILLAALRATQAQIAQTNKRRPEEISTAKLFPRAAAAHFRLVEAIHIFELIREANPGVDLKEPDWATQVRCYVRLSRLLVAKRTRPRKKPGYSKDRTRMVPLQNYERRRELKPKPRPRP